MTNFEQWWEENYEDKCLYDFERLMLDSYGEYPSPVKIKLMLQVAYEAGRNDEYDCLKDYFG